MLAVYMVFGWSLAFCYGFVLISSAAGINENTINLFQIGEASSYDFQSVVLLNEKNVSEKSVGFYVTANVDVHSVWAKGHKRILKIKVNAPHLFIRSRKAPSPDGFVEHTSKLEQYPNTEFFVEWRSGIIPHVYLPKNEDTSISNLKKGIASLLQFQIIDGESVETDTSGECNVSYTSVDQLNLLKTKIKCKSSDLPFTQNKDPFLDTLVESERSTKYNIHASLSRLENVESKETHTLSVALKENLGVYVESTQTLVHLKTDTKTSDSDIKGESLEDALLNLSLSFTKESLVSKKHEEGTLSDEKSFAKALIEAKDALKPNLVGTVNYAKTFLRLVSLARRAKTEVIQKALEAKKIQKILEQVYDILGHVQTEDSHHAVMKKLFFEREDHLDGSERYLWALSVASNPNKDIVRDLHNRYRKGTFPDKVKETLVLTLASMAHKLRFSNDHKAHKIAQSVEEAILTGIENEKDEKRHLFLRALKNLKSPSTIPVLIQIIQKASAKEGVLAFKAIREIGAKYWSDDVKKTAIRSFYQIDRRYDSSSRTLSADILLESNPTNEVLVDFLHYLRSNDSAFEVKQYVNQRIKMISEKDEEFGNRVEKLIKSDPFLNNYSTLSPRGLSTALRRSFYQSETLNGSLVTIQEMNSGIVKRGIVNVAMDKDGASREMISLGIFAGGLGSFVSSSDDGGAEEEGAATAGMELTVLGTQIRPFVFFSGQGELMGHVWSGTASERTNAFQATSLLHDHLEYVRLGSGFIAVLDLKGVMSFDLSGKIEISIWGRTADSLVEKSAGLLTNGQIVVDTSFVKSQVEFSASLEPKLSLKSDIDFSSNVNLCMRLTQPDTLFRHNVYKIERIPGSKHKLRMAKYRKSIVPGTTYSLNKKNNDMCSARFS